MMNMNVKTTTVNSKCYRLAVGFTPILYIAIMSFSVSDEWFRIDDPQQFLFVSLAENVRSLLGIDAFSFFRPVKNLLFLCFSWIAPFGFEWCHAAAVVLCSFSFFPVLALCKRILTAKWKALAAACIWLFSPTLVSSVAWLSCINIVIMVSCASLAIVLHDSAWKTGERPRPLFVAGAALSLGLALLSYESAVSTIPVLILFDLYLRPERLQSRKGRFEHSIYVGVVAVYLVVRQFCSAALSENGCIVDTTRFQTILSAPYFFVHHFLLWIWPFNRLYVFNPYKWGMVPFAHLIASWIVLGLAALFCFSSVRKNSVVKFCILFFLFGFAPTSNCLGFGNGPFGDYYLGFGSIGLAAGLVELTSISFARRGGRWTFFRLGTAALAFSRLIAVGETFSWARTWSSGLAVLSKSIERFPDSFPAKMVYAYYLIDEGKYAEAVQICHEVEASIVSGSKYLGSVSLIQGICALRDSKDPDEALSFFDKCHAADSSNRKEGDWHYWRGRVFEDLLGNEQKAEQEYLQAVSSKSPVLNAFHRIARMKAKRGENDEAIALWRKVLRCSPNDEEVLWSMAMFYRRLGKAEEADRIEARLQQANGQ